LAGAKEEQQMEVAIRSHAGVKSSGEQHPGPSLVALALVATALFVSSLVVTGFFTEQASAVRLAAVLQLGGAIVFGNFAAATASRLWFLGVRAAGVQIALFGGIAAAVFAVLSSLLQWVLTQPEITTDSGVIHLQHLLVFAMGVGHIVAAGLLLAGASLAGGVTELLPRWLMWLGPVLAAIAELSTLTLLLPGAAYRLPVGRLGTFIWMLAVGACLPKSLADAERARRSRHEPHVLAGAHSR
jgi:hypothetical protein